MYKISLKNKINFFSKSLFNVPKKSIISHTTLNTNPHGKLNLFHLHAEVSGNIGYITLNRDHKFNTLSPTMLKELTRFLKSMDMESNIRGVWLSSKNNDIFSKGTDFKLLYQSIMNKKPENAYDYLKKLYDFSVFLGKFNKPILLNIKGEIASSAASIFSNLPFIFADKKTIWYLNETGLGYIPDSGSSYFLSRMQGELGTYLALTGNPLYSEDLLFSKLALEKIYDETYAKSQFKLQNSEALYPLSTVRTFRDPNVKKYEDEQLDEEIFDAALQNELKRRIYENGEDSKQVLSEILYKKKMAQYSNYLPEHRIFRQEPRPLINHLLHYKSEVIDTIFPEPKQDEGKFSNLPLDAINRCFSGNTMEDIIELLRKENSQWAKETLKTFETKSPLSLKLSLRLIREGVKSNWEDCFVREYRVACRRINDEEFKNAVKTILYDKRKKCSEWKYKNFKDIPQALVDGYFRPLEEDLKIQEFKPDLKPNALFPVKSYYETLPDSIRFFLNEESTYNSDIRDDQYYAVKTFLTDRFVDYQNPNYSTSVLREKIFKILEVIRKLELEKDRAFQLVSSSKNLDSFYDIRMNILKSQLTDDSKVKQLIDNSINRIFSEKFHEKFTNFKENCKLTHYQTRRDFFLKMKYLVFNKNFLYDFRDEAKIQELAKNLSIPLFFPDNDKENFLEVPNPELAPEKFPPAEMTKFIKKNKLGEKEQYKVLAGKDEISKFFDEKKEIFSEKKNERDLYFKPTPQTIALKEKTFEYQRRYGLKDREKSFREDYIKETMKYIRFSRTMQNYIFNNVKTDLNDFFFENQKATYKDIALEFLADMKVKEKITKEPIKEADLKSLQEKIDVAKEINKEMKAEYDGERFDLQMTGNLKYNNFKKLNEKNIMEQVLNFIANEPELKTLFDPLVTQVNCKYGDSLRDKYLKLFLKIYEKHSEELLKRELNEFKSAAPLLTRNGQTPFLFENKDSYMDYFDDHIHRSVGIDFHKLIMDDVLYIFSYFVLIELERKLNSFSTAALNCEKFCTPPALNDKIPNYTKRLKEYERSIIRIYKNHGLIFENFEEMQETIDFMNSMCFNMGGIHSLTRDKIKFPHTRLYKNYQEKINEKYQDYEGFMQEFVSKYEFQKDLQTKIKKLELEKTEKFFILDNNNDYDLSSHNLQSLVKEGDSKIFEKLALNQISPLEQKVSKIGVIDYLRKLEGLTARGINGKYNFLSNEYDIPKEMQNIPDYFGFRDQRQSAEKWLEEKIYEYVKKFLDLRFAIEQNLSKNELALLDLEILQNFSKNEIFKAVKDQLFYELSILKLLKEQYQTHKSFEENYELFASKPPNLYKTYMEKIKNPDGLNKLLAFSIKNIKKTDYEFNKKVSAEEKLDDFETYKRISEEVFQTPEIENFSEKNKIKGYLELKSVGLQKQKKEDVVDIKNVKDRLNLGLKDEIFTILSKLSSRENEKTKDLQGEINEFLEKFSELS